MPILHFLSHISFLSSTHPQSFAYIVYAHPLVLGIILLLHHYYRHQVRNYQVSILTSLTWWLMSEWSNEANTQNSPCEVDFSLPCQSIFWGGFYVYFKTILNVCISISHLFPTDLKVPCSSLFSHPFFFHHYFYRFYGLHNPNTFNWIDAPW